MSYREVEDVVDFDDDELNMARNVVEQAEATREEDDRMRNRFFAEYRAENNYESDSGDGDSQDEGSYPDYDAHPQATGMESPSSNVSNLGDAFYPEDDERGDYESDPQDAGIRYPPSDVGGFDEDMERSEEDGDSEADSQDTSFRYPPSDVSGPDQDMLASSEHSENADLDDELYELARPPSPMSTDDESESDEDRRVPSPMNTDVEAEEDIEMSETSTGQPATSFNSEMSEIDAHPVMPVNLSETAAQPVPSVNIKSQISPFDNLLSSPPQAAYTIPANPKFVIGFGVDTSDLAPLKPDTDMSEAPLQTTPLEAQDTKELQSELEPALQSTTEVAATDPALKTNQDRLMDVSVDVKTKPALKEPPIAPEVLSFSPNFQLDTKMSPTVASPALQSFDANTWSNPFNFAPEEPVEERQHPAPANEARSSGKDECIEEKRVPENKPSGPSYKDAGTQTVQDQAATDTSPAATQTVPKQAATEVSPEEMQTIREWAAAGKSPQAQKVHSALCGMEKLNAEFAAFWTSFQRVSDTIDERLKQTAIMMAERPALQEKRHAERIQQREERRAARAKERAERDKREAEQDARSRKRVEDFMATCERLAACSEAQRSIFDAFAARVESHTQREILSPRIKELLAAPSSVSEEERKKVQEAKTAIAEWNARYETHVAKVEALGEKIKNVKL